MQKNPFNTAHLQGDLKHRTVSSGIVRTGAQGIQFVLTFGYNIVMARVLTPEQFGLVAIGMTIIGVLQIFRDMGLSTATIQRNDITHAQVSNLFWVNVGAGAAISLLIVLSAPFVAWFFNDSRLFNITLSLAGLFLLNGLAAQHSALLNRQMRFMAISMIDVVSMTIGFLAGVLLAFADFGCWSLVIATLTQMIIRLILTWSISGWMPHWPKRGVGTRALVMFGTDLTIGGFVYSLARGSDTVLLGRVYGSDAVGLYTRAAALLSRPMEQLVSPIFSVMVPALSRLQDQPERYRRTFLLVFEGLAIFGFLFTALTLPLAGPLTITLLGERWSAAIPVFAGLSAGAIFVPLSQAASWLYTSQGRGREGMVVAIISGVLVIGAAFAGLAYGPTGVAIALSAIGIVCQLPLSFYIGGRSGPVSTSDLWRACMRQSPVCIIVGTATWIARVSFSEFHALAQLIICATIGAVVGCAALFLLPASRSVCVYMINAFMEMKTKRAAAQISAGPS